MSRRIEFLYRARLNLSQFVPRGVKRWKPAPDFAALGISTLGCPVVAYLCICLGTVAIAADQPAGSVLHLTDKSYLSGQLRGSNDPNVLRWQSAFFTQPFEFPLSAVNTVHYALPKQQPKPTGEYCFELVGGDVLYGNLLGLNDDDVSLDDERIGRIHVRRKHIRRFYRWQGAELIYLGPSGLAGWKSGSAKQQWRDEGGMPATDVAGATMYGDFRLPVKAVIEFELSWKSKPDFLFALGVNDKTTTVQHAFRFEVWDSDLVAIGESRRDADLASLQQVSTGPGHIRVQAYLDQEQQSMQLFSRRGEPLAKLKVNGKKPQVHGGLRLTNKKGNVRLERLRISRWNGVPLQSVQAEKARLHKSDGSVVYGHLEAYDAKSKKFTVRDGNNQTQVDSKNITDVFLSPMTIPDVPDSSPESATATLSRRLRVVYQDGSRFSGELMKIEDTHISLTCAGVKEPLRLPLTGLRSLVALSHDKPVAAIKTTGRVGRLEIGGLRMKGRLVNGAEQSDASCLVWRPNLSINASPMQLGVAGRIVYRDPPPKPKRVAKPARAAQVRRPAGFGAIFKKMLTGNVPVPPKASTNVRSMHLRCGDTIPCDVAGIDEDGITFKTPLSEATFVKHEKVKSIELTATRGAPRLAKTKRQRLLTLPRNLKNSPPTHLICAKNGDFLRGRVMEMDENFLTIEVRLETRKLPRDRISQIIWLHADELIDESVPVASVDASGATRVQTLRADGNRLTFVAEKLENTTLSGTSEILGACRTDITKVDQLLFGPYIEQAAAKLAYHRWRLHHATEPKFVQASAGDAENNIVSGTQSPLVGQPSPDFELDLLDGKRFHLADHKGKVVILDFWATWCGPCLQTMPLIDEIAHEFADKGVELIAVNMEEQPRQIKSMLERHKLKMPVVLDLDGVVAAKYAVTAIPQTVVIDQAGKVTRLFVGGGPKLAEPLREALRELTEAKPTDAASQ